MSRGLPHHPPPSTPQKAASVYRDDDRDMLESLKGLSIKNFHDCNDGMGCNTPSSNNSSLPTPPALKSSKVYLAAQEQPLYVSQPEMALPSSWSLGLTDGRLSPNWCPGPPPNAPQMKDLDSFTDYTGHSSFDFQLSNAGGADDVSAHKMSLLFHHPENVDSALDVDSDLISPSETETIYSNSLALDLLPCTEDPEIAVRAWIEGVEAIHEEETTPRKRRRSLTASSEAEARRVRAWSPTVEPSHAPHPHPRTGSCPIERQEQEAPD